MYKFTLPSSAETILARKLLEVYPELNIHLYFA